MPSQQKQLTCSNDDCIDQTGQHSPSVAHPSSTREQRLDSLMPRGLDISGPRVFVSSTRHQCDELKVPAFIKVVLTTDMIQRLCSLWACLYLSGGHEIHRWNVAPIEFLDEFDPADSAAEPIILNCDEQQVVVVPARIPDGVFDGLHACVFADGDVSFYVMHNGQNQVSASLMFSLAQFWNPTLI